MNVPLEEPPALGLGSVSTLSEVTSANVIKASTLCTLAANTSVMVRKPSRGFALFCPITLNASLYCGDGWDVRGGREL